MNYLNVGTGLLLPNVKT